MVFENSGRNPNTIHYRVDIGLRGSHDRARSATPRTWRVDGDVRHPVFGNTNNWVDQDSKPFLTPALLKKRSEVLDLINLAVEETNAMIARGK